MQLLDFLKSDKEIGTNFSNIEELKGGMSSNRCFRLSADNTNYTLIVFREDKKTDDEIFAWHDIVLKLKDFNPTVRYPIENKLNRFIFEGQNLKSCLYTYIEGNTIPWSAYNSNEISQLGSTMRNLHNHLNACTSTLPLWKDLILEDMEHFLTYINFVSPYIKEKIHIKFNEEKLKKHYKKILDFVDRNNDKDILHYDLQRANLIFKDGKLNGIIDFEKACVGPRIADISKTCAYLMHDKKWHSSKYIKYYFLKGYGDVKDIEMLEPLIIHYFFIEMKNWLFNTPFEDLNQNKVFTKIKQYLIKHNYVSQS